MEKTTLQAFEEAISNCRYTKFDIVDEGQINCEDAAKACYDIHKKEERLLLEFLNSLGYFFEYEDIDLIRLEYEQYRHQQSKDK